MRKRPDPMARGPNSRALTRREVLAGAAAAAIAAGTPAALAAPRSRQRGRTSVSRTDAPLRRYMAASAALGDGRILVTGGYGRPWSQGKAPMPLGSAMIFDPGSGTWWEAAPMSTPRARHAAVALSDGRVAVLGGMGMNPTASVEIYDPRSNSWSAAEPLGQPRYDHSAVLSGAHIHVLGGSSQSMLSTEAYQL